MTMYAEGVCCFLVPTEEGGEPLLYHLVLKKQKSLIKHGLTQVPNDGGLQTFPFNISLRVRMDRVRIDIVDITFVFTFLFGFGFE